MDLGTMVFGFVICLFPIVAVSEPDQDYLQFEDKICSVRLSKLQQHFEDIILKLGQRYEEKVENLERKLEEYEKEVGVASTEINGKMDRLMATKPHRHERTPSSNNWRDKCVSFNAAQNNTSFLAVSNTGTYTYGNGGILKFHTVRHNVSPEFFGYDARIGFYRCPYDGYYMFFVNVLGYDYSAYHQYSIIKEGSTLSVAYTYAYSGHMSMSAMAITHCSRGQDVWVANTYGGTRSITVPTSGVCHFAGFRIY